LSDTAVIWVSWVAEHELSYTEDPDAVVVARALTAMVVPLAAAAAVAVTVWADAPVPTTMTSFCATALGREFTCKVVVPLDATSDSAVGNVPGTEVSALS
jgi:hypothetical protein